MARTSTETVPAPPDREGGSLTWAPAGLDLAALQEAGWAVHSFRELRDRFIVPAQSRGTARTTLDNPAKPLLDLLATSKRIAVVGVSLRAPADLRDLYGFVVEPAYRQGLSLLIASDRELGELDAETFVDPVGYPWTLERLQYIAARYRVGPSPDGLPPLTPIEARLYGAMRDRGLAPIAQYGIGKFRVDFAFTDVRLIVECDGRPWHDPERDRRRDEALRRKGWEPLHFTGSEIHRDAPACAAIVVREIEGRRAIARSEQPEVVVPMRRSWWAKLMDWLRSRVSSQAEPKADARESGSDAGHALVPVATWAADLDAEQRAAVTSHDGVVQVIAPAGSGKTTVLVARVRELVARGVPPNRVLCCTFNTAAAAELQVRLDQAGVEGVDAATFHAIGRRILKRADLLRGDVLTISFGQWRRLARLAMDATADGVWIEAAAAKEQVSDLKLGRMLTVGEYAEIAVTPAERTLAKLYEMYENELEQQDRTDFDDFIFRAVRLLQRDADVRSHWQGEFTAVLVDEYQDIEPAQELLVQMLAAPEDLLLCVGDEDQCLYAWRRASVERVIELDQLYPGLERHALARNYRCPIRIVDASRGLIQHNRRRFPKQILAAQSEPGVITLAAASDLRAQGAHVARLVKDLEHGQAVILARTSRVLSEIALGLAQEGIRFFGPERIKRRSGEPAILLSYLRVLGAPTHARPEDVGAIFRVPNRYLPDDAEDNLASALRSGLTFAVAMERLRVREDWRRPKLKEAAELFDTLTRVTDASRLIHRLRTDGGLDRHYAEAEELNPTDKSAIDSLVHAQDTSEGMSVVEYAGALDYEAHIIEQHFDPKGIELATIHGAKGRQWPMVIVGGVEEGELPHARSLENASDPVGELEGERRLAYVAFTRARNELVLMYAADHPSRFIAEAALAIDALPLGEQVARTAVPTPQALIKASATAGVRPLGGGRAASQGSRPHSPPKPAALVLAPKRDPAGSIPCSLPGCFGTVRPEFVRETTDGFAGLCPKYEGHDELVTKNPEYDDVWAELSRLNEEARREWRLSQGDRTGGLIDGAIRCSLSGCEGVVKSDYVFDVGGIKTGLCPQKSLHRVLARHDPAVDHELQLLEAANRAAWIEGSYGNVRSDLLLDGGIPCSVPGCRGVVGRGFVISTDDGGIGICGMAAEHGRLIAEDPQARREFDRLEILERERRRSWSRQSGADPDSAQPPVDLDDLPF